MDNTINLALKNLDNGWVFEDFGLKFLSARLGYEFIPVGGSGDKGLDGFHHTFSLLTKEREIFQLSTEKSDPKEKIYSTIKKLTENNKTVSRLTYVTNRKINNKDTIIDEIFDETEKTVRIWDINWFEVNLNHSDATIRVYDNYIKYNLQEYNKPGKAYTVANLDQDSRLYVFLRQQIEDHSNTQNLNDSLIDSLILYHLENTDPETDSIETEESIINYIKSFFKKDDSTVEELVKKRLEIISKTKGRKIQKHTQLGGYCLPFKTRKEITERNLRDIDLEKKFFEQTSDKIKIYLKDENIKIKNVVELVKKVIHTIFYKQGLEFSNFILNNGEGNTIEKQLIDVVEQTVNDSSIINRNKNIVQECLMYAIRDIVYNGTEEQRRFLKSLSNTYMLMFMLQWDPKIAIFFQSLANKLTLFVGNSILIPAFSEMFLDKANRRHWNLLKGAQQAGVSMVVNDDIVDELVSHFKMIRDKYEYLLRQSEDFYLEDDYNLIVVEHIILRAYFYAKKRNKVSNFNAFLNHFIDPDLKSAKLDLIELLKELFGIDYLSKEDINVEIDNEIYTKLLKSLSVAKGGKKKAETDAKLILTIHGIREKNNETNDTGVFGYKTWWLSKDTSTLENVKKVLDEEFHLKYYMRPDFLYNYIALAPKREDVKEMYEELFPSLLGVNLSYHLSPEVAQVVQQSINDHKELPNYRKKSTIRKLTENLKTDISLRKRKNLQAFFENEFKN